MIRLGLRLTLSGGREAVARLVITALATALGVAMLLVTLAVLRGVDAQNNRYAWLMSGASDQAAAPGAHVDPVWWLLSGDDYRGTLIGRVDVAVTGPDSPVPPGLSRLPRPGEYFASPALSRLLRSAPHDQLAARFPGRQVGTIGAAGLPSPDQMIIVVGRRVADLAGNPRAERVTAINETGPGSCKISCVAVGIDGDGIALILSIATAALLFPVLIFVGAASRLSTARREQRFAAMRLVGATPRQISIISAVESGVAAVAGVAVGFGLYFALRPALALIPFTGEPFFVGDLSVSLVEVLLVVIGVPIAAAVAARLALRGVTISPLGVSRRVTPPAPRAWRLLLMLAGIAELAWFVHVGRPRSTPGQIGAYLTGIMATMAGLVLAGPWLTAVGSRFMSRGTRRPAVLIAARRLGDNPRAGFRAVSGVVLALFVTSVAIGVMTTINAYEQIPGGGASARGTLVHQFTEFTGGGPEGMRTSVPSVPARLLSELRAIPGVRAVTLLHKDPSDPYPDPYFGLVSCADLARTPVLGHCPAGASAARVAVALSPRELDGRKAVQAVPDTGIDRLPVQTIVVNGVGAPAAVERARTVLEQAYGYRFFPETIAEDRAQNPSTRRLAQYQQLADVVMIASLAIAGCSLAVSVASGISERRRPFSLLRLSGAPLTVLRRVVTMESAVPLVGMAVVSIGTGFLTAGLFLDSQMQERLRSPGGGYVVSVLVGLVASLAIIGMTLPLLERVTGPESARND